MEIPLLIIAGVFTAAWVYLVLGLVPVRQWNCRHHYEVVRDIRGHQGIILLFRCKKCGEYRSEGTN